MRNLGLQKLSKEQKEKWERISQRIRAQEMVIQDEWSDMSQDIFNFEKITHNRHLGKT